MKLKIGVPSDAESVTHVWLEQDAYGSIFLKAQNSSSATTYPLLSLSVNGKLCLHGYVGPELGFVLEGSPPRLKVY